MPDREPERPRRRAREKVEAVASRLFAELTRRFPVQASSDEFHYFPQVETDDRGIGEWDDLSPQSIAEMVRLLEQWEAELESSKDLTPDPETSADVNILVRAGATLRGEFDDVRFFRTQPTLYLSICSIGLAEALERPGRAGWQDRIKRLPEFLDLAAENLEDPPAIHRDLGLEMAEDTKKWIESLPTEPGLDKAIDALRRFGQKIKSMPVRDDFRLEPALLDRVVRDHVGCGMSASEAMAEIEAELREMEERMADEAARISPGAGWAEVMDSVPLPPLGDDGLFGLYRSEVGKLGRHCLEKGLVGRELYESAPVKVEPTPPYLAAIRSAAAYSMPPGHPPRTGTFYIIDHDVAPELFQTLHRDCRMLAAHETYPGHHLLDSHRWRHERTVRRHLEFPLFYEGWACFGEELMRHTGYFDQTHDRLILARRNYWRAIRGKIDLGLQAGEVNLEKAADMLAAAGMDRGRAGRIVNKYTLKPAYQLCYTIGSRRFRALYERLGSGRPGRFAKRVLAQGEIGFDGLERALGGLDR